MIFSNFADITKEQNCVIEYSLEGTSACASPAHEIDINDSTPLFHQIHPEFHPQNNGMSLHKAVRLFTLPTNPLIGDDSGHMDVSINGQSQDELDRETVI